MIIAKIQNWNQKKMIMEKKKKIYYIDNDLTINELLIQNKIREMEKKKQ